MNQLFQELQEINARPAPFEFYTAEELWTKEHTARQMLDFHLNEAVDLSSRNRTFINQSVEWMRERFQIAKGTRLADFGCGPGFYTSAFAEIGAEVTGIDFSKNSLTYAAEVAEEKNLDINYVHSNYLEYGSDEQYDLITMIMCDFCALSPDQRRIMFQKFRQLLKEDGAILLDVYTLKAFEQKSESAMYELNQLNQFWSPDDYYGFLSSFKYEDEKITLDKYTIVEPGGNRIVYNWLQHFSQESLKSEFEANGLIIEEWYSDVSGGSLNCDSQEMAIVARKTAKNSC